MIIILDLSNRELVIGEIEYDTVPTDTEIVVHNPMYIVQTMSDFYQVAFKLEDALIFAKGKTFVIKQRDIVTAYEPHEEMKKYYQAAIEFNKEVVKPLITKQIVESTAVVNDNLLNADVSKNTFGKRSRFKKVH